MCIRRVEAIPDELPKPKGKYESILDAFMASDFKYALVTAETMHKEPLTRKAGLVNQVTRNSYPIRVHIRESEIYLERTDKRG